MKDIKIYFGPGGKYFDSFTAWMPLPEPYREPEDEK